mgnify:FL=1|jgi:hypothetical protein
MVNIDILPQQVDDLTATAVNRAWIAGGPLV